MVRQASPIIAVAVTCALAGAALLGGCSKQPDAPYAGSIDAWHAERIERLQAADGWLTLIGLFPLTVGEHRLGCGDEADLRIEAAAPPIIGTFKVQPERVSFSAAEGLAVQVTRPTETDADAPDTTPWPLTLGTDREGAPMVLTIGTVSFHVIERGEALFLRVRDSESAVRRGFFGIERFSVDASWRVAARLESGNGPKTVMIPDVLGRVEERLSSGLLVFERGGLTHRLTPIGEPGQPLFIIFHDQTSGVSTYGGGRYLYADAPDPDGTVILDFNRAYNPPCAFTPYATCPLPPKENVVQASVTAGEKSWPRAW